MNAKLVPERLYKENRANWNANYLPENTQQSNGNWVLPAWNEPSTINWNQLQPSNVKNGRKASGKQHYIAVARYVAGPSASLASRYRMFRDLLKQILIPCSLTILGCTLLYCMIWENELRKCFTCLDTIGYFFWDYFFYILVIRCCLMDVTDFRESFSQTGFYFFVLCTLSSFHCKSKDVQ